VDEIRTAGGELVLVGNGSPEAAARFERDHAPGITILTDPGLAIYRELGLKRGVAATMGPRTWGAAARALARGHRQTALEGDPWQQGGLFVLAPGGHIVFGQRYDNAGDRPDIEGALRAVRQAASRSARKRRASG
jgi:hypothetical protein